MKLKIAWAIIGLIFFILLLALILVSIGVFGWFGVLIPVFVALFVWATNEVSNK